jgi:hypothetical protein
MNIKQYAEIVELFWRLVRVKGKFQIILRWEGK